MEVIKKCRKPLEMVSLLFIFLIFIDFRDIPNRYALLGAVGLYFLYTVIYKKLLIDLNGILAGVTLLLYAKLRDFGTAEIIMYAALPASFAMLGYTMMLSGTWKKEYRYFYLLPVVIFLIGYSAHGLLNGITYFREGTIAYDVRTWKDFWSGEFLKGTQHSIYILPLLGMAVPAVIYLKKYKAFCSAVLVGCLFFLYYAWDSLARTPIMVFGLLAALEILLFVYLNRQNKKLMGYIKKAVCIAAVLAILGVTVVFMNWDVIRALPFVDNLSKDGGVFNNIRFVAQRSVLKNLFAYPGGGMPIEGLKMAHNVWLDMALDTGIITFGLFTLYTVISLFQLKKLIKSNAPDELKYMLSGIYFAFFLYYTVEPALNANIQNLIPWFFCNGLTAGIVSDHKKGFYEKYIKRPQDFLCALLALIVLSPVMAVTAYLVKTKLGSPVIFTQERPGLNGKIFKLYKFRSMTDQRDEDGNLLPDEVRLTSFGKKLRATSLDELPELINILKGDMSVVGPRPLLVRYLPRYNAHQARRHEVRPGFTGYAQVNGRNTISWEEKFNYDVEYVDHITFVGDWKIIFQTIGTVLRRDGINSETAATMEEFMGTEKE